MEGRKNVVQQYDSGKLFSMVFQDIAEFVMIESPWATTRKHRTPEKYQKTWKWKKKKSDAKNNSNGNIASENPVLKSAELNKLQKIHKNYSFKPIREFYPSRNTHAHDRLLMFSDTMQDRLITHIHTSRYLLIT